MPSVTGRQRRQRRKEIDHEILLYLSIWITGHRVDAVGIRMGKSLCRMDREKRIALSHCRCSDLFCNLPARNVLLREFFIELHILK